MQINWHDSNGDYDTWHWTRPPDVPGTDSRGVSVSVRKRHSLKGLRSVCQIPEDPELQGRAGIVRLKKAGFCDIIVAVAYLPGCSTAPQRKTYRATLSWIRQRLKVAPRRCLELLYDGHEHALGQHSFER